MMPYSAFSSSYLNVSQTGNQARTPATQVICKTGGGGGGGLYSALLKIMK